MFGASIAGIMNSTAQSDDEARKNVVWCFGSILGLLFVFDIGSALSTLYLVCQFHTNDNDENDYDYELFLTADNNNEEGNHPIGRCIQQAIKKGFRFHPICKLTADQPVSENDAYDNDDDDDSFGDLFLLSSLRCVVTVLLLMAGARYGRHSTKAPDSGDLPISEGDDANHPLENATSELEEPLLRDETSSADNNDNTNQLEDDQHHRQQQHHQHHGLCGCHKKTWITPTQAKNLVFATLFLTSSFYQVYAGLKVSTTSTTSNNSQSTLLIVLLCMTVLWINAQGFVFRTLLEELTREDGLFLPPEGTCLYTKKYSQTLLIDSCLLPSLTLFILTVHRHPLYYQDDRGLAMHWCDLCRQRITSSCYRCSLCDFDV
jgi:hypothetical protein